jgi:hypothetical protein
MSFLYMDSLTVPQWNDLRWSWLIRWQWEGIALSALLRRTDWYCTGCKQYLFILPPKADDPDNKKQGNNTKQRSIQSIMSLTHQFSWWQLQHDDWTRQRTDYKQGYWIFIVFSCSTSKGIKCTRWQTLRRIGKHTSTKGGNERQGNQCKQMNMSKCNKSTNAKSYKLNYFAVLHQFSS